MEVSFDWSYKIQARQGLRVFEHQRLDGSRQDNIPYSVALH
jgi:hypothetical protein